MRPRTLAVLWLLVGIAIWCGWFDLAVARGADDYLRRHAEFQAHLWPEEPSMAAMMARTTRHAALVASLWAGLVVSLGWLTIWISARGGARSRVTPPR